ncbi:MAG TPA: hypothetical protein VEL47_02710 [Myxococcota bacterium]|nr:hypothetical protein [Myxococcota bacterium]
MNRQRKRLFFSFIRALMVSFVFSFSSVANTDKKEYKSAEASLKFNMGAGSLLDKWRGISNIGGSLAFDYNFFRYFSLGAELGIRSMAYGSNTPDGSWQIERVLDLAVSIVPKLLVPIELGDVLLTPYLGVQIGAIPIVVQAAKISHGIYGGIVIGIKCFFTHNFGLSLDHNPFFELKSNGVPITGSFLSGNLGIIYAF